MTTHLIAISIGPVQEFIAAGRRTNDLYAGSALIAELTSHVAGDLVQQGARLIFPASAELSGPNKILAELPGDPKSLAEAAEKAAKAYLRTRWTEALAQLSPDQRAAIDLESAEQQINSFLEFYAAWWPWDGQAGTYAKARRQVERLLAGRKALRDFTQPQKRNLPKSALDPSRDTVVRNVQPFLVKPPRMKPNEYLDAVSVLKRVVGSVTPNEPPNSARSMDAARRAQSTADIAAKTYLEMHPDVRSVLAGSPEGAIYNQRRKELEDEGALSQATAAAIAAVVKGEPCPYFAVLQADGDQMGRRIGELTDPEAHREFSSSLSTFASNANDIIEKAKGRLVYSGGDDVLAFLPLYTCLSCAGELARTFHGSTGGTMSVGVAVVHYIEPLYISLQRARDAEHAAKEAGRNRLNLAIHTRGGEARSATVEWKDGYDGAGWVRWTEAFRSGLSRGFAYEMEKLARQCEDVAITDEALQLEAVRILKRKSESTNRDAMEALEKSLRHVGGAGQLKRLAIELIVCRWLSQYPTQWRCGGE